MSVLSMCDSNLIINQEYDEYSEIVIHPEAILSLC